MKKGILIACLLLITDTASEAGCLRNLVSRFTSRVQARREARHTQGTVSTQVSWARSPDCSCTNCSCASVAASASYTVVTAPGAVRAVRTMPTCIECEALKQK